METKEHRTAVRFGPYEVDFEEGILRKYGLPLKVQGKPLAVLSVLIENAGKIVSREQLHHALWPDNTFVDFDKNLSTAVNRLREALCDTAREARYIETLPRKGYRFRATIEPRVGSEAEEAPQLTESNEVPMSRGRETLWSRVGLVAAAIIIVGLLGTIYYRNEKSHSLNEKDTVIVAEFENSTGDAVFDDTLKTAFTVSLRQSPFLNVLTDGQVASTLQLMTRAPGERLTPSLAREVCLRAGSKAYLAEAIGSLGNEYILRLQAVECKSGVIVAEQQMTAASKDKVVEVLGEAAVKLRGQLGESLATVQRFDVPLEQATTSSLEALKAYTLAQKTARENGAAQSLPFAQRAIELDPNFAMAYEAAGIHYSNLAEPARASEYVTKAFQLRDHASEREKLRITAAYYSSVTGELSKAEQTFQQQITEYPRDIAAYNNLGIVFAEEGQYERAVKVTRQGIAIDPTQVTLQENLTAYLLALQNFDEARQIIREAQPRKPDNYIFPAALYAMAFFTSDSNAMAQQQKWFADKPEYENFGLALAADTEAFTGHLGKAGELTAKAVDSAARSDRKETGAIWEAEAAIREAALGGSAGARRLAAEALRRAPASQGVESEAALALALAGDETRSQSLAQDLDTRFPLDAQLHAIWLPAIRAQWELKRKNPAGALKNLEASSEPMELGSIAFGANASGSCLFPTFLRGEAYLAAGQGNSARAEFDKVLVHKGIVWNCWTGALARLGAARANALQATDSQGAEADAARVRAIADYKQFLALWKDADPDLPALQEAKLELARIQ